MLCSAVVCFRRSPYVRSRLEAPPINFIAPPPHQFHSPPINFIAPANQFRSPPPNQFHSPPPSIS